MEPSTLSDTQYGNIVSIIETLFVKILSSWANSVLSALRRRPRFKITLLPGPTFCCTFPIGQHHGSFEKHRTAISLYLSISNVGSAASSIDDISVGYHWHLGYRWYIKPFRKQWWKYRVCRCWLTKQSIIL